VSSKGFPKWMVLILKMGGWNNFSVRVARN
jgi:hypothetical protein